jgi:hypothetical protein
MHDEHTLERQPVGAPRWTNRAPCIVHERLGLEQRDTRATRSSASLTQATAIAIARPREAPPGREPFQHGKADVVAGPLVFAPRIPEPDDEPIRDRAGAREPQWLLGARAAVAGGFLSVAGG